MKCKISIFLTVFFSLRAMDAPLTQSELVPVKLQALHNKEQRKFKKYDLAHPEKFVQLMQEELNNKQNKEEYLKQLQIFLSGLLAQHILMEQLGESLFFSLGALELADKYESMVNKLKATVTEAGLELNPETAEQLNIVLAHINLINKIDSYSDEELSIIFSWIFDTEKGTWLNTLGHLKKTVLEHRLETEKGDAAAFKASRPVTLMAGAPFASTKPLLVENFQYAREYMTESGVYGLRSAGNPTQKTMKKITRDFTHAMINVAQLYRVHQKEYQLLHDIVKKELFKQYRQAVSEGQKIPASILLPIPEELRKQNALPSRFPDQLETIKNPATYLTHASLEPQLEKARIEWEKKQATQPKPKKKKRHAKYVPVEIANATQETELAEQKEVKKIKIGADGSYIEEGAEDNLKIEIEHPTHRTTATIFKTKNSPQNFEKLTLLPKINYTSWVTEWFENPENAIVTHGYKDPKNPRYRAGQPDWMPIALHAFPRLVDDYIYHYGSVSQTPSRMVKGKNDTMVTIPGKMEYPDGKEETGVFTYIIDATNGQWYHRMFTPSSHKKMAADFMEKGYFAPEVKGYYDVYFPPLAKP